MIPEANWFVARGFAVAVVSGRGSGISGGKVIVGKCGEGAPPVSELADAADLRASIQALIQNPAVDGDHIVAVGDYRSGMGAAWLTEDPPAGLLGAISINIGWNDEFGCRKVWDGTFDDLGHKTQKPILWVATHGSDYKATQHLYERFIAAGGKGNLMPVAEAKPKENGIFETVPAEWPGAVEPFLASLGLATAVTEPLLPTQKIKLPPRLDTLIHDPFEEFLAARPSKAFAVSPSGHWGWSSRATSRKEAEKQALGNCLAPDCYVIVSEE
jgi:hypothetical protein